MKNFLIPKKTFFYGLSFFLFWILSLPSIVIIQNGLDPSWKNYLAYAIENKLQWGTNIIFTYGILSQIWTLNYSLTIWQALFLKGLLNAGFIYLLARCLNYYKAISLVFLSFIFLSQDQQDVFYFFYLFLIAYYASYRDLTKFDRSIIIISLAVISHIKFTFSIASLLPITILLSRKRFFDVFLIIGLYVLIWLLFQKDFISIFNYWKNSISIASGYNWGMQNYSIYPYDYRNIYVGLNLFLFIVSGVILFFSIQKKWIVFFIGALNFFVYKESIVRADEYHVFIGIYYLCLLHLFVFFKSFQTNRIKIASFIIFLFCLSLLVANKATNLPTYFFNKNYFQVKAEQENSLNTIKSLYQFPQLRGCSDLYPYNLSVLMASSNEICSRPIFQSYSAYTKELLNYNLFHLFGNRAPDNIFWSISPIDYRYATMDDSLSWLAILSKYIPVGYLKNNYVLLEKTSKVIEYSFKPFLSSHELRLGEKMNLPNSNALLWLQLDIEPRWYESLIALVYKPNQINLKIYYEDHTSRDYKLLPEIAKTGFIISPTVENNQDFFCLYTEKLNNVSQCGKKVVAIELYTPSYRFMKAYLIKKVDVSEIMFRKEN